MSGPVWEPSVRWQALEELSLLPFRDLQSCLPFSKPYLDLWDAYFF